jgi:hypothetical protein
MAPTAPSDDHGSAPPPGLVAPAKTLRLLWAIGAAAEELKRVNPDDAARRRMIAAHRAALIEVASTVSDPLIEELVALGVQPLDEDASIDELKVAQAQLLGWVDGALLAGAHAAA